MNTFPPDITEKDFIIHFMGSNRLIEAEQLVAYLYEKYDTINFPSIWQNLINLLITQGRERFFLQGKSNQFLTSASFVKNDNLNNKK